MRFSVSDTAEFGDYVSGPRIVDEHVRETMRAVLAEIRDGSFARRWIEENERGRPEFERYRQQDRDHQIEQVGAALRAQMTWLNPVEVREGQAQASAEMTAQASDDRSPAERRDPVASRAAGAEGAPAEQKSART
jgi:hypothetical protein